MDDEELRRAISARKGNNALKRATGTHEEPLDEMAGGGFARIAKHMNAPFAMISAFRILPDRTLSKAENLKATADLAKDLIRLRIGGLRMDGHYGADEISFFVPAPKGMPFYQFLGLMTALGSKYDQESVGISDGKNFSLWYMDDGHHEKVGQVATMRPQAVQDMWSKIKKKNFVIVPKGQLRNGKPDHIDHTRLKD